MKSNTTDLLKELKLPIFISSFVGMDKKATKDNWSYEQFLKELCLCELDHRKEVRTENLLKQSKIPLQYTLDGFDQKLLSTKVRGALPLF